uniref:RdRp n=1 Tax=Cercospora beticola negative-stranded virus 1 TaxID=2973209 RepID=A0A976XH46_9MONO|nr:RdRp [Cercospora beticola negative-stranded virus 1]
MSYSVQRSITTRYQATSVVSTNISKRLNVSSDLERFASGMSDEYIPRTLSEYKQYRTFAHDILCLGLISGNFYDDESFTIDKINLKSNDPKIITQKPDLYSIEGNLLKLCEVSLTYDLETTENNKNSKYDDLIEFIERSTDLNVNYTTLLIDLTDAEWTDSIPSIPENHKVLLERFIDNLVKIHSTKLGIEFRKTLSLNVNISFPFSYNESDLYNQIKSHLNITEDLKEDFDIYTRGFGNLNLESSEVKNYLDKVTDTILTMDKHDRPFPCNHRIDPITYRGEWDEFLSKPSTTEKIPVVLQLGMPNLTDEIQTLSKTEIYQNFMDDKKHYGGYVDLIKSSNTSVDEYLENGIMKLFLTESQLASEMMSGPGRKKYLKQNSIKLDRKAPTHLKPDISHESLLSELTDQINEIMPQEFLKTYGRADYNVCGNNLGSSVNYCLNKLSENGTDFLLQFYTRLSTEVILNSMRRRKQREYVLGHSGFEGVYFLIAPGPQLRTEANVEFIKIISFVEPIYNKLSREWHLIGDHWESSWLSVDTDRLKHWSRSRHRVNLSLIGSADKLLRPGVTLTNALSEEINNSNYTLMSLIYLENKSNTSTTIQTTRYFLMKCLGDRNLKGLVSKFPSRVNSILQSVILQRNNSFVLDMCSHKVDDFVKLQHVKRDENIGHLDETTTGVVGAIPRIFTKGNYVPIKYSINEIYWCMMYNKDRQNQTQDAMKILNKIAKEERKFDKEIQSRNTDKEKLAHCFGFHTTSQDIHHITTKTPESHYFSALAVHIGVALQDRHPENFSPQSGWMSDNKLNEILSKNLSEYATFKASVNTIKDYVRNDDLSELKEIGRRTKCIELIYEIVNNEKLTTAADIAMSFSGNKSTQFKTVIQIFKKNQIGGVREILILYIKARVLINLCEEISRLLSKSDKRETLTKGRDKRLMMRGDYEELTSKFEEGTPLYIVKNSYDMSTWCQKFIPTIFLPIYNHHHACLGNLLSLCRFVLIKHCQKEIEYPQKLVTEWIKHPDVKHDEDHMQYYKEKFQSDRQPKMLNFSNMGQGILHYNSTVLALSCQSLRDKLFYLCLEKLSRPIAIRWKTRVGSDDKGDTIFADMSKEDYIFQCQLLEQCASVSERLHSMDLSVKSASGNVIYEFNSAYMANLEVQSPVVKFTMAAVDMIGTDSCTEFVNESYSRIRQLRENGANSLLCYIAHIYNKDHFDEIFRTGESMTNDPTKIFNLPLSKIPYDLGNYPIYDCDVQDMVGPEYHNYRIFNDPETPERILRLLYTSHFDADKSSVIPDDDEGLFKKDDFRIAQGMVRQLSNMRNRLNLDRESIHKFLEENPFLIVRGPMTVEETAILIAAKLYTRGASKSLRRTSPAIYLGRLAAFESARAWNLFQQDGAEETKVIKLTFSEYIKTLYESIKIEPNSDSIKKFKPLIFPQYNSFDVVTQYVSNFGIRKESHKLFSQSIRTWILNNFNYNFTNSLKSILETSFNMRKSATREDVMELRKVVPFDISNYDTFINNCRENNVRPLDLFYYLTKFYKNTNLRRAQVFAVGPSTSSLNLTLSNLKRYNHLTGSIMELDTGIDMQRIETASTLDRDFEIMKLSFNFLMLETQGTLTNKYGLIEQGILNEISLDGVTFHSLTETIIRNINSISGFDNHIKRIIILLASKILTKSEFLSKILSWKQFSFNYLKKQKRDIHGDWHGDLSVLINYSNECFTINQTNNYKYIEIMRVNDLRDFQIAFRKSLRLLGFTESEFTTNGPIKPTEYYVSNSNVYESRGYSKLKQRLNIHKNPNFKFLKLTDLTNFKVKFEVIKTGATIIKLVDQHSLKHIDVAHFPGHYYPVEIPLKFKMSENIFVNGLRGLKLFKNRKWFFDGRLYSFNTKGAIDILQNHINLEHLKAVNISSKARLQEYINDMEYDQEDYEGNYDVEVNPITEVQLRMDLVRQTDIMNNNRSIKDMFQDAANKLMTEDYTNLMPDEDVPLIDQFKEDAGVSDFIRALGQNKYRKKKDFYMVTNLRLNTTFVNRVLDLFFKGNSIMSEQPNDLPDYGIHCLSVRDQPEADYNLISMLFNYICLRISSLTGKDMNYIQVEILKLKDRKHNFNTLPRLNKYLTKFSPGLYELLDQNAFDGQDEESEGEFDF